MCSLMPLSCLSSLAGTKGSDGPFGTARTIQICFQTSGPLYKLAEWSVGSTLGGRRLAETAPRLSAISISELWNLAALKTYPSTTSSFFPNLSWSPSRRRRSLARHFWWSWSDCFDVEPFREGKPEDGGLDSIAARVRTRQALTR